MKCAQCEETAPHTHDPEAYEMMKELYKLASKCTGINEVPMFDRNREIIMLDLVRQCRMHINHDAREAVMIRLEILEQFLTDVLQLKHVNDAQTIRNPSS